MRLPHSVAVAVCLALIAANANAQYRPGQEPKVGAGSEAPSFTLKDCRGNEWKLSSLKGRKVILLDFGRTDCIQCRSVAKDLQTLDRKYSEKGLQIFTICLNGKRRDNMVPEFIKEMKLTFPVLLDSEFAVAERYRVATIPHLVLIDTTGKVVFMDDGYDPHMVANLSKRIDPLLPRAKR